MTWQACAERLVGRADELAVLKKLLAEAATSASTRFALVIGEPGVGKSRLVREFAGWAGDHSATVLTGWSTAGGDAYRALTEALAGGLRGRPLPDDPELAPYLPVLGNLLPQLASSPRVASGRVVLGEAVLRLTASLAGTGGTVLILEDTQWADPDTLDILTYLTHAAGGTPLVLVLTARDDADDSAQIFDLAAACSAPVISLSRLSDADVRGIVECCTVIEPPDELVRFIVDHAEGIPLLVEDLLTGLATVGALNAAGRLVGPLTPSVPRTFAATVRRRLEALDPVSRQVVDAAAVLGRQFPWRLLPAITGVPESEVLVALRTAVGSGLAEFPEADTFRFRHALTRDAVCAELVPPDRSALARAAAAAVERSLPDSFESAAELWAVAGERDRAARGYLRAAKSATARAALHTAELLLGRAVQLAEPGSQVRLESDRQLLYVLAATGQVDRVLALGESMLAAGDDSARLTLAEVAVDAGRPTVAAEHLAALAEDSARASVVGARIAYSLGDLDTARAVAEKALLAARDSQLWTVACDALQLLGKTARLTDLTAARSAFAEAEELARTAQLPVERRRALHELGTIDLLVDGSIEVLRQTRELAVAAGLLALTATVDVQIAAGLLHRDPDEALGFAQSSARMAQGLQMELLHATALFFAAAAHAHRREPDAMEMCIAKALALAPEDLDVNAGIWGAARAHVALLADDLEALATCLDTAVDYLRRNASTTPAPTRGLWALVRTLADRDGAAARAEAQPSTVNWENRALLGYAEAVAAGRRGDPAAAERAFADADEPMAALPWWRHRLRVLIAPEAVAAGWGEPVRWANEALEVFRQRGDQELVAACRGVFHRAQVPVRRRGRGNSSVPPGLARYGISPREMDVLTLVGLGLTDGQIADRLVLSKRTVESHVGSARRKTGAADRRGLRQLLKSVADGG